MADTHFSGEIVSDDGFMAGDSGRGFVGEITTFRFWNQNVHSGVEAELALASNYLNQPPLKVKGYTVISEDTGLIFTATGSATTDVWVSSNNTSITPA